MKILLDTSTFLWIQTDDSRLSEAARRAYSNPENWLYLSSVSSAEIAIKYALKKLPLPEEPRLYVPGGCRRGRIKSLSLDEPAALRLATLPALHNDPFDRLLICQAVEHRLTILTSDSKITQYAVSTLW